MSDIKKWMKIVESVEATIAGQPTNNNGLKENETVTVSPKVGGGVGRFVEYTQEGAVIDIKGVMRELSVDDFSKPVRNLETGNDWFHVSQEQDTVGTMNDKPEFRSGDIVKIDDVYDAVIGPGFGVFVAYSTDGKDCIVSFDSKEILVPVANISSVVEQDAKDNFDEVDNDGNLSPMSLGSDNIKIEEPKMDHRDEFSKWIASVEEALSSGNTPIDEELLEQGACGGCGAWDCPECFPDTDSNLDGLEGQQIPAIIIIPQAGAGREPVQQEMPPQQDGIGMAGTHPVDSDTFDHDEEDEIDVTMMGDEAFAEDGDDLGVPEIDKTPKSGKGVKLGHIVQKFVKADSGGEESPLTHGDELEEDEFDDVSYDAAAPIAQQNYHDEMSQIDPDEAMEIINKIKYMQDMGLSKSNRAYSEDQLAQLPAVKLKQVQQEVMGEVAESGNQKPTKTKTRSPLDDFDTMDFSTSGPLDNYTPDDVDGGDTATATPSMPAASAASTRAKTGSMNPSQQMRDMMNRISPDAGGDEPELEPTDTANALVSVSAQDVPAIISSAMQASGTQVPEWHNVNNLPGYQQQNVRGMGRQLFSMFTRTPLEKIQTIANVDGQGPNTDAEMRAVASWLQQNADDLGEVELNHGRAIPGYKPDVKEYSINGVRFHVVRDPMGQYIYAYPDADATTHSSNQLGNNVDAPRLNEEENMSVKLSITEAIKFDDIIREGLKSINENVELDESSLSKLIGKQKGGQKLVQWLHRKHKLGNDAEMTPQPFSERMLWKEFKSNPDNFVIVSATGGVAGIKPYEQMIKDRTVAARKKGKEYNPAGDSTLQYQVIAFTDDGKQVDPALLQPRPEAGEERDEDPTVMRARMGKINGKDMQNPDNVFNLLADQIGALRTVYLAAHGVERDKMKKRSDLNAPAKDMDSGESLQIIFKKIRPVLKRLADQALSTINNRAKRFIDGGNFEGAQKIAASGAKLRQFLATIDTSGDVNLSGDLGLQLRQALAIAANAPIYSSEFNKYMSTAARGNSAALKPVLDAMRDKLVAL